MSRIGVFGGTFDPIHVGHLAAAHDAASALVLDRVLFVPNRIPPHKRDWAVTAAEDRVAMVRLAIEENERFQLSTIELEREGPSYTLDTMRALRGQLGQQVQLIFLVGCDALAELHTWHRPEQLVNEFEVVLMDRPTGEPPASEEAAARFPTIREQMTTIHVAQLEISARDIRRRVREGRPIQYLVTTPVARYIADRRLYME